MDINIRNIKMPNSLKLFIKIAVSIAIIAIILNKIDEKLLLNTLLQVNLLWIIPALLLFILSKVISAYRLNLFLQSEGVGISYINNLKLYWLCMYYNLLLPGGISGDGYKIKVLIDTFQSTFKKVFKLIIADRINGIIALGFIAFLLTVDLPEFKFNGFITVVIISLFVFILFNPFLYKQIGHITNWQKASGYSLLVQTFQLLSTFFILLALGIYQSWSGYLWLFMVSSLSTMIPITIGGAGARELTFLYGSKYFGLDAELSVAVGFLFYLISTSVSLTGMYYSFHKDFLKDLKAG